MNSTIKTIVFWAVIVVSAAMLWQVVRSGNPASHPQEISYSHFLSDVADGKIAQIRIEGSRAAGDYKSGGTFAVVVPSNQAPMMEALQQHGVEIWFREAPQQGFPNWLLNLAPLILLGALWFLMIRQMRHRPFGQDQPRGDISQGPRRFGL